MKKYCLPLKMNALGFFIHAIALNAPFPGNVIYFDWKIKIRIINTERKRDNLNMLIYLDAAPLRFVLDVPFISIQTKWNFPKHTLSEIENFLTLFPHSIRFSF